MNCADNSGFSTYFSTNSLNIMVMDGRGVTPYDPCIHSRIGGGGTEVGDAHTDVSYNVSKEGIGCNASASLSHAEIQSGNVGLEADVMKASGSISISSTDISGEAGVYIAESTWTISASESKNSPSVSLEANVGVGASLKISDSGITFGATIGLGLEVTINWGVFSLFQRSSSDD